MLKRSGNSAWPVAVCAALGAAMSVGLMTSDASAADTIKICVIDDHSGDFALPNIPKTHGAQLAVDEINAAGGVLGKQLELIHYDGQSDVKRYQEMAQKCTLDDEVDVLMAGYTSSEREAARAVAVKNKTIFWHNNQGEGGIADKYSFFTGPTPEQQILTGVRYMIDKYGPNMYVLAADYGFGQVSALWTHVAAGLSGGKIVGEEFIPLGNSEYASSIANIQRAKPDFMVHYLVGANQSQFYPQANAAGLGLPAVSTVNLQQGYEHLRFPAPALQNMYIPVGYIQEIPTEANKDFIKRWHAVWPEEPYINQPARCAYVAVKIMAKAWDIAGTTETDAVISALESGIGIDAPEGPVLLDPATHHLSMVIRMAHIDDQHKVSWVHDFGSIETWWLRSLGVNLVAKNDAKQYLPWDDPRYAKYQKQ